MSGFVELVGTGKTGWSRSNDGHLLASADLGWLWNHPTHVKSTVDDSALDRLDANRVLVNTEDACTLAGRRADSPSELWEVVGHKQTVQGVSPLVLENKLIPLWNDVRDWAARVRLAEGNTAVHAACRLVLELVLVKTL